MKRYLDMVSGAAVAVPERTAIVYEGQEITYAQLDDRVGRLGAALRDRGLTPGDRVALLAANELEYMEIQGACLRSGFTLVPLNTRLADPELEYIVGDSSPGLIIAGRDFDERVKAVADATSVGERIGLGDTAILDSYDEWIAGATADPDADPLDPELNATFLYTSGTTGRPKGAMIDRRGFTARVFVNAMELEISANDVWLQSLPMFHISAYLGFAFAFRGATSVMLPSFTPADAVKLMTEHQVTSLVLVPTMISMLLDDPALDGFDAEHLRLLIYGGAPIDGPLLRRALDRLGCGFHQQYGMTETGAQCVLQPWQHDPEDPEALSSGGHPAASFEMRVVDDDDLALATGETGEIVCRGPAVMSGYWNLPEATADTLRNGWMHTGDVGWLDDRGLIHVVDRRNDMIISGGENVYPREVEAVLAEHPAVPDAAVIGLPDDKWGQVVSCVVAEGAPADDELEEFLRARVAGYKVPRRWIRVAELPRNATGKVLKAQLRSEHSS